LIPTTQFGPIAGTLTQRHDSSPCTDRGQNVVLTQAFRTAGDGAVYHQGDKTAALTPATDPCTNIITTSTGETAHCLNAGGMGRQDYETETMVVAFTQNGRDEVRELKIPGALPASPVTRQQTYLSQKSGVRRLTPEECELLQGFPKGWTLVNHRSKPAADGPRYKAIGNSMAVPVIRWICKRIQEKHKCQHTSTPEFQPSSSSTPDSPSTINARQV
jgi:site-specific DNA-cytosine methylase